MSNLFRFKYPKIFLFIIAIILAYYIFKNPKVDSFISGLGVLNYIGVFIAGMFFAFGFTAPFSVGFFLVLNPENIFLMGVIGGFGAMLSDLLIFRFIQISFKDEFEMLRKEKIVKKTNNLVKKYSGGKIRQYLFYVFAAFIILSPFPDEFGVTILAGLTKIKINVLAIIGFILNTIGIWILLLI